MKNYIFKVFITSIFLFVLNSNNLFAQTILLDETFEDDVAGVVTTSTATYPYMINGNTGCVAADGWKIGTSSFSVCVPCTGNEASIDFGSSTCNQNATLVVGSFTPTTTTINVTFDYSYTDFDLDDSFIARLYNKTTSTYVTTFLNLTIDGNGGFSQTGVTVVAGNVYEIRFTYIAIDSYGATVDNIKVSEISACSPLATFTQTCNSDLSYSVAVNVTNLAGNASVKLFDGTSNMQTSITATGVPSGSPFTGYSGTKTFEIISESNATCKSSTTLNACSICSLTDLPSDLCVDAPTINLSQPFSGSTRCGYTASTEATVGTNAVPAPKTINIQNDGWIKFVSAGDSVVIDYSVFNCEDPLGDGGGIQLIVYDLTEDDCATITVADTLSGSVINQALPGNDRWQFATNPNAEYLIRIDGFSNDLCDYTFTPVSGVAVVEPNDTCPAAINAGCNYSDTASTVFSTNKGAPPTCSGLTPGKGNWYSFIGTGDTMAISTDNNSTNFDTRLFLYSGTCSSLTSLACDDNSGTGNTSLIKYKTTPGVTYFVYVDGANSEVGQYEITINCTVIISCDCNTPNCPDDGLFPDISSTTYLPGFADANCLDPFPNISGQTFTSCHTVTASADGRLGFVQGFYFLGGGTCGSQIASSRTFELKAASGGVCSGPILPADVNVATSYSSTFNPEWYNLTPNGTYILCLTTTVPSGCTLDYSCLEYYNPSVFSSSCQGSLVSNDFEDYKGADGGWTDYRNGTGDLDWIRGTNATINASDPNATDYIYIIDNSGDDVEQHLRTDSLDLSSHCKFDISLDYIYNDDGASAADKLRLAWWDGIGTNSATNYHYFRDFTTDQLTWTNFTTTYDRRSGSGGIANSEWSRVFFEISYEDNAATAQWAAVDNICITPIDIVTNVALKTNGVCNGNNAEFSLTFNVSIGSGNYEIFNTVTNTVYGTISGGAINGTGITINGVITGPTIAESITVDVRETGNTCSAGGNPITIIIPQCGTPCINIFTVGFESGLLPSGWSNVGADPWVVSSVDLGYGPSDGNGGSTYFIGHDNSGDNPDAALNTSVIDLSAYIGAELSFYVWIEKPSESTISVNVSINGGATFTDDVYVVNGTYTSWTQITLNLDAYAGQSNVVIQFEGNDITYFESDPGIDDIELCGQVGTPCDANPGTWD